MQITPAQKTELHDNGFLFLKGAVAPELVNRAMQAINHRMGEGIPTEELASYAQRSFFPDIRHGEYITDLFNASQLRPTLQALLGEENVEPTDRGQIALRFPLAVGTPPKKPGPHIDGLHSSHNGVPKGTLASFTSLVGVFLSEINSDYAGNLAIWPGSHLKMEAYFRENGIEKLLEGRMPDLDYGEPMQIKAQPGDAIIAHYQLLHGVTINIAPMPRYATFFRVTHPLHHENRLQCLTDLWLEWPGAR